ncbi:MAG: hypothetical protein HQK81_14460 [Desulfovibrionaceae bacterium]|nr:hypothetical protein [Desulfovibrionaceae bacterium]MBF0515246.1 hypothetical protein [Desulfovibrionaceae bacterium]
MAAAMQTKLIRRAGADCKQCSAPMDIIKAKKYESKWAAWLIGAGVLLSIFGGIFIGPFLILGGVYMAVAQETITCCPKCGYYFKAYLPKQENPGSEE